MTLPAFVATTITRKTFGISAIDDSSLAARRQIRVNISSEKPDRVGDIVVQAGIDFSAFMAIGGTVLWQHDSMSPVAKCIELKIIRGQLQALVQFPPEGISAKADEIYGLIRAGVVNAASIGFQPKDEQDACEAIDGRDPWAGLKFNSTELMEFSFVSVPASREATIVERSRSVTADRNAIAVVLRSTSATVARREYETRRAMRAAAPPLRLNDHEIRLWLAHEYPLLNYDDAMRRENDRLLSSSPHEQFCRTWLRNNFVRGFREKIERRVAALRAATCESAVPIPVEIEDPTEVRWNRFDTPAQNIWDLRLREQRGITGR